MPAIHRADAPAFPIPHNTASVIGLSAPSRGAKETCAWEVAFPPHAPGVPHAIDHEEVFVVLAGRLTVTTGDEVHEVGPGDAVIAPAHQALSVANTTDEPASAIAILPVGARARIGDGEWFVPEWTK